MDEDGGEQLVEKYPSNNRNSDNKCNDNLVAFRKFEPKGRARRHRRSFGQFNVIVAISRYRPKFELQDKVDNSDAKKTHRDGKQEPFEKGDCGMIKGGDCNQILRARDR